MACGGVFPRSSQDGKRGFTGQEEMTDVCLANYNTRIYDYTLGRFTAADPVTQNTYDLQDLNRYSYVVNDPLSLTDPTGYVDGGGGFFKTPLAHEMEGIAAAFVLDALLLPELEVGVTLLATDGAAKVGTGFLALNAGVAGGVSGAISTGTAKGALMGGLEAEAFFAAGSALGSPPSGSSFFSAHIAAVFIAHGAVGGLFSIGQKGGFGGGFLSAGFASLADAPQLDIGTVGNVVTHTVAGGIGSVQAGGKFENGAATGAFGYLLNELFHSMPLNVTKFADKLLCTTVRKTVAAGNLKV